VNRFSERGDWLLITDRSTRFQDLHAWQKYGELVVGPTTVLYPGLERKCELGQR